MKKLRESRQVRQHLSFEVVKALEYLKNKGLIVKDIGQGVYQINDNPDNLGYIYLGKLDIQADEYEITGRDDSVVWKGCDWEEFMDDIDDFVSFDAGVPYQPNGSERDQNLQDLVKRLDSEGFTTMVDRAGRVIVDFDTGSFDIDYVEGEWVYVVHYSGEFYEFTIYREWADDVVSIIQSVSEDDAEEWAQAYVNEKSPFDESAKRYSRKSIKESEGVEIYPEDGKLKAKFITKKVVSSKTKNKLSDLKTTDAVKNLSPKQKKATNAVIKDLKTKGKLKDISDEFDIDPKPDLTFKSNGDVEVTPDSGKKSYTIPEKEVEKFEESECFRKGQVFEGKRGRLSITKQVSPDTYLVSYQDFLLASLSFTDWTFSEDELKETIRRVQSGEQLVWKKSRDAVFNEGLISFNQFVDYAINAKLITNDMIEPLWTICCTDLRSKSTGDIYWHGSELDYENDRNTKCGYIEDFEGILDDALNEVEDSHSNSVAPEQRQVDECTCSGEFQRLAPVGKNTKMINLAKKQSLGKKDKYNKLGK